MEPHGGSGARNLAEFHTFVESIDQFDASQPNAELLDSIRDGIAKMREVPGSCPLAVEWIMPMKSDRCDPAQSALAKAKTGFSEEDLLSKGLSVLMRKKVDHKQ